MNNEVEKNKMENNSKKKIIILIIIIVGTLLLLGISIFINSINNSNSRFYDYKKLINSAEERNNYFKLDCNLEDKNNNINCKIKLNSEVTNSIDSSYILEYLLLDFEDTDDLEIVSIDTKRVYDEELPSYFDVSKSNNMLLIENKDQRVGSDIYFDHNYYTKGTCGKKDNVDYTNKLYLLCNDSLENLEIDVKFKLLNENLDKVDIKNFGTLYVYLCDYGKNTSICKNYKYSKLYTSFVIKKNVDNSTNNNDNNSIDYSNVIVPIPEKEINIDISNTTEVLNLGKRLWDFAYNTYWGKDDVRKYFYGENNDRIDLEFCKKNMSNVSRKFTDEFYADFCFSGSNCSKIMLDKFLENGCNVGGRGALQDYKTTSLKVDSIKDDEIHYVAVSEYCGGSFCHETPDTVKTIEKPFIIKKVDNEWKINYFYIPN